MRSVPLWIRRSLAGREPESTDFQRKDMADREAGSGKGAEEEGGNEPDKDGFTKLTKAEQLELPFDLPDREKG